MYIYETHLHTSPVSKCAKAEVYFSDYEKALKLAEEIGIKVFGGVETSYKGTDFLVYGLDKEWFLRNPQIMDMKKKVNASRKEEENNMAKIYAEHYGLIEFAGSDNHIGKQLKKLAGMCSEKAVMNEQDFIFKVKNKEMSIFTTL